MSSNCQRRFPTVALLLATCSLPFLSGCGESGRNEPAGKSSEVSPGGDTAPPDEVVNRTVPPGGESSITQNVVGPLPPDPSSVRSEMPGSKRGPAEGTSEVLLSRSRYFRLELETVDPSVLVTVSRRWLYKDGFPEGLVAAIRKHPDVKTTDKRLFDARDGKIAASQYIRWEPGKTGSKAAALLLFVDGTDADGEARHELAISVDLELDATLGQKEPKQTVTFDDMTVELDLASATLASVNWGGSPLADADGEGEGPEHTVDIRVTGTLTAASSANVRGADALLADEVSNAFRSLAAISFQNESHHGITLGWLGLDHLRHGLIIVPRADGKLYDLQYSVSGESFDLTSMRRQLEPASWPLILRGRDFVGTSLNGQHVFQPVECLVSRKSPAAQPAAGDAKPPASGASKKGAGKAAKKAAKKSSP